MRQKTIFSITLTLAILIGSQSLLAEGPLRKRLFGEDDNLPTTGRDWKVPGGRIVKRTRTAMSSARERLAFWRKKEERESNAFIEGTGRFFRPDLAAREDERKPFSFVRPATWLEPVEEPNEGPQSVHDWIGQPRPGFE